MKASGISFKKVFLFGMAASFLVTSGPSAIVNRAFAAPTYSGYQSNEEIQVRNYVRELNFRFSINAVAGTQTASPKLDAQGQQVALDITLDPQERQLYTLLKQDLGTKAGFDVGSRGFYMQLSFSGTTASTLLKGSVEKDATQEVTGHVIEEADKKAQLKKEEMYAMIPSTIAADLQSNISETVNNPKNPYTAEFTTEQKNQLIQQQTAANLPNAIQVGTPIVKQKIDAGVDAGKKAQLPGAIQQSVNDHVTSRMDDLQEETAVQRLRATFAIPINPFHNMQEDAPGLIILSLGKDHIELGPQLQSNMLSDWENTIGRITPSERGNTVASTGYASLGIAYAISKNLRLLVNVIGFHDRDPWMSAQQYLGHSFQISTDDFEKNQQVAALDSVATVVRTMWKIRSLTGSFWGTLIKRANASVDQKDIGISFGGNVTNINSKTTINFSYADSGKAYFNKTWGVGIAQTVFEKQPNSYVPGLILYADYRGEKHKNEQSVLGDEAGQRQVIAIGAKLPICSYVNKKLNMTCSLTAEYQKELSRSGHRFDGMEGDDIFVGVMANASYDFNR